MVKKSVFFIITISILIITGCGGESKSEKTSTTSSSQPENNAGTIVYKKFCASCHQSDGKGVPGMYPPIGETKMVNGNKDELIKIILNGMSGEIEVKGEIYNNVMPAHHHLSDKQIADLLTYIRSDFGNNSEPVTPEEVEKVRQSQ